MYEYFTQTTADPHRLRRSYSNGNNQRMNSYINLIMRRCTMKVKAGPSEATLTSIFSQIGQITVEKRFPKMKTFELKTSTLPLYRQCNSSLHVDSKVNQGP